MDLIEKIQKILNENKLLIKYRVVEKFKFLFIGGTTYLLNLFTLFLFSDILKFEINLSITLSFFLGVIYHFTMNKFFVFQESSFSKMKFQIIKYIILIIINYFINLGVINLLLLGNISKYIGQAAAIIITMILTYFVLNKLVFNKDIN